MWAAGEIAAAIYNTNRSEKSDPVLSAADFVPKPLSEISKPAEPEPELDIERLAAFLGTRRDESKASLIREK